MDDDAPDKPLRGRDLAGLGGLLAGSVVGGTGLGLAVDAWAGSAPVGALVGLTAGVVAGGAGFWARVRVALRE